MRGEENGDHTYRAKYKRVKLLPKTLIHLPEVPSQMTPGVIW